jgi:type I site-specific restriction-modification system R (restriction) subunit
VIAFIRASQPARWDQLEAMLKERTAATIIDSLTKELASKGTLGVLRHGFKCYGKELRLAYFQPNSGMNPDAAARYAANRLTITRQVEFLSDVLKRPDGQKRKCILDVVLSVNGLPVVTVELKNPLTGQRAEDARKQYMTDRDGRDLLFRFKERALVHFAVDPDEAWMATELKGSDTYFLPFNRGHNHGAGNPPVEGNWRTHYLWDEVLARDSLLDILKRFMHLDVTERRVETTSGHRIIRKEAMIFPRYHQLDAVRKLVSHARVNGSGRNYLVQHSAGSGKSNSIAWLAHRLATLVVTGSRLSAVKYKQAFDRYIKDKGYQGIRALVAFSGTVEDPDDPGSAFTEVGMNDGLPEKELPERFGGDEYRVLIVAEKYQTGFDQPLLQTMYVVKKLAGVQAVQTLSRLNRTAPGKTRTFVLDFKNEEDDIFAAFKPYYETTPVGENADPQKLNELHHKLLEPAVFTPDDVREFSEVWFKARRDHSGQDHRIMNAVLDRCVDRFEQLEEAMQDEFRGQLTAFRNLYSFLSQIMPYFDEGLEQLYAFLRNLSPKLPQPWDGSKFTLDDDVALKFFRLQQVGEGTIDLSEGQVDPLKGPTDVGTAREKDIAVALSTLVEKLNERFGTDFYDRIRRGDNGPALISAE